MIMTSYTEQCLYHTAHCIALCCVALCSMSLCVVWLTDWLIDWLHSWSIDSSPIRSRDTIVVTSETHSGNCVSTENCLAHGSLTSCDHPDAVIVVTGAVWRINGSASRQCHNVHLMHGRTPEGLDVQEPPHSLTRLTRDWPEGRYWFDVYTMQVHYLSLVILHCSHEAHGIIKCCTT